MARSGRLRRPGRGLGSEDQSNLKTGPDTTLEQDRFRLIVDGQGTFAPGACAPPRRTLDDAVSPSTIRLKRASTIAEIRSEEFCALLPGADEAGANNVALRLLETVRGLHHPETGGTTVTISIGVAVMRAPAEPIPALQRRLDQALYRAKAAGRDRIEHAAAAADTRLCASAA
jgi:predicted signal transduction protein with EAL and GGDEF domain